MDCMRQYIPHRTAQQHRQTAKTRLFSSENQADIDMVIVNEEPPLPQFLRKIKYGNRSEVSWFGSRLWPMLLLFSH